KQSQLHGSLESGLRDWYFRNNIPQKALTDLLKVTTEGKNLPNDSRTFLKTPVNVNIENICGGELYYFVHNDSNLITLQIGIDGIPISNSSSVSFWPILRKCDQLKQPVVFLISLFQGTEKPDNVELYLSKLVDEVKELECKGLVIGDVRKRFKISCLVADAPARCYLKQSKMFNGFHGCERCTTKAYIPAEFARKTRSLKDLKHYKATEYRLFVLFTGIVVLKDIISPEEYEMFFLLQCAVYILLSDNASDPEW
ncbi:hypothetical protein Ocin01_18963, partial [Orchesella cincta]